VKEKSGFTEQLKRNPENLCDCKSGELYTIVDSQGRKHCPVCQPPQPHPKAKPVGQVYTREDRVHHIRQKKN
jgi:hypothetical protein